MTTERPDRGARALAEHKWVASDDDDGCCGFVCGIHITEHRGLPDAAELERLRRIEAAARRLDRAYGPRSIGMVWTVTQEMVDAWRELQEAFSQPEGSAQG